MTPAHRIVIPLAALALTACGQRAEPEGNSMATANAFEPAAASECTAPTLAMAGEAGSLKSDQLKESQANFQSAYEASCAKDVLNDEPLIDPKATDQGHIFLVNAPEANVAAIYLSDVDGSRMVLEYPFLTTDGKSQVPTADELEEAIYCSVVGATPEEQESTGRCLVD
jgi:hypothetical protein